MNNMKVHLMHVEVSATLERLSKLFKPGMKITFIARLPGNGEADVLIGDDHDADELIALVRRRFGASTVSAPGLLQEARELLQSAEPDATQDKADIGMCAQWDVDALALIKRIDDALRTTSAKGEAA